jgi:hypothetical protein
MQDNKEKENNGKDSTRFKWHKMLNDIKEYVSRYEICKKKAIGGNKAPLTLDFWKYAFNIHVDLASS